MRLANCKTVCREIDELNVDQDLSTIAREHIQDCEQCQTFYDGRRQLRTLLMGLEPIEAPADFEFKVRARLANAEVERQGFFGSRSFGVPAAALTTIVLLLAAGFALRTLMSSDSGVTAGQIQSPAADHSPSKSEKQETVAQGTDSTPNRTDDAVSNPGTRVEGGAGTLPNANRDRERRTIRHAVASPRTGNRVATQEFGITPAEVVKRDDALASLETFPVFAVETSSEPLKVSLDYETGVSRTISLPALSFGSQRALAPSGTLVKTSSKGVW